MLKSTTFDSAMVVADQRGVIIAVNDRCSELFGFTCDELMGQKLHVLMPSPYKEQHLSYVQRYLASGAAKVCCPSTEVGFSLIMVGVR
jgi:PAS domain S-box-containing protein